MLMLTLQDEEGWPSSSGAQNGSAGSAHANGEAHALHILWSCPKPV